MSYINGNNIYGARAINETPSKSYSQNQNNYQVESEIVNENELEMAISESNIEVRQHSQEKCSCQHNPGDNCHIPNPDQDNWSCGMTDKCCAGDTCSYDPSKAKCVCTYMDIIFSEDKASGSTLFDLINTGIGTNYTITTEYKSLDPNCCTPCLIDTTSIFTIESESVTIKNFTFTGAIAPTDILINGIPVLSATATNNGITALIDPSIIDANCAKCNKGTKAAILLNALQPWSFIAKIELCGKVTTNGTTCRFKISIENKPTTPEILPSPSTFVAPEVCLPNVTDGKPIVLDINFDAFSQIINPVITAIHTDPADLTSPIVVTLTGNVMINTNADLQIMKNTKVCFNAMV